MVGAIQLLQVHDDLGEQADCVVEPTRFAVGLGEIDATSERVAVERAEESQLIGQDGFVKGDSIGESASCEVDLGKIVSDNQGGGTVGTEQSLNLGEGVLEKLDGFIVSSGSTVSEGSMTTRVPAVRSPSSPFGSSDAATIHSPESASARKTARSAVIE